MKRHSDEAADRKLIRDMLPGAGSGELRVNPAGCIRPVTPPQVGLVPIERTMRKPRAYKETKGAP